MPGSRARLPLAREGGLGAGGLELAGGSAFFPPPIDFPPFLPLTFGVASLTISPIPRIILASLWASFFRLSPRVPLTDRRPEARTVAPSPAEALRGALTFCPVMLSTSLMR